MAADNWRTSLVKNEILRYSGRIAAHASQLEQALDFPNDAPKHYAQLVGGTALTIHQNASRIPPGSSNKVVVFLRELWGILRNAERSRISTTPWSMIQSLENFYRQCVGNEKTHFLIRPQWNCNYSIHTHEWVSKLRSIVDAFGCFPLEEWERNTGAQELPNTPRKLYTVSFPRMERKNALLHSALAHEIGHALSDSCIKRTLSTIWMNEEPSLKKRFQEEANNKEFARSYDGELFESAMEVRVSERVSSDLNTARKLIEKAFSELCADAIGYHLLGPAAFAAYAEIAASLDLDSRPTARNNFYPSWRYRLRILGNVLLAELNSGNQPNSESNLFMFATWLREIITDSNRSLDLQSLNMDLVSKHSYEVVERNFSSLRTDVINNLPEKVKIPYHFTSKTQILQELVEKLGRGIPPNEYGTWPKTSATTLADILNAGWAFKLNQIHEISPQNAYSVADATNPLLLKAIESSFVHDQYKELFTKVEE